MEYITESLRTPALCARLGCTPRALPWRQLRAALQAQGAQLPG